MENSTGKIIAAFLAGAAAGASLGLLLAPDKGVVTRQKLKNTLEDIGEKASEQFSKFKNAAQQEQSNESKES